MPSPMKQFQDEVIKLLAKHLPNIEINLEIPPQEKGDFSFPCFNLTKTFKKSPILIAKEISEKIGKSELIEKVVVENAYLNFYINKEKLKEITLNSILNLKEDYGKGEEKKERIILEHTSANPTGPLHVGRARNPIIGDTLARILRKAGYKVLTEYYVDDIGKQAVILTYGVMNIKEEKFGKENMNFKENKNKKFDTDMEKEKEIKIDHQLVGYYQKANKLMEENENVEKEIGKILYEYEKGNQEISKNVKNVCEKMLSGIKESLNRINIKIDNFVWESQFVRNKAVDEIIERLKKTKYCKEEENAFYLNYEEFGIQRKDTKFFFVRKDGTSLYATRDIAYHIDKFKRADHCINILGEDHKLQSNEVSIALKLLNEKVPEVIFYSFVSLPEGRMSTRRGRVVYLDDLIEEAEERAFAEVKKRRDDLTEEEMKEIAKKVGVGALRYNIIKVQSEKAIVFRWEDALNFEGNSSPFLQYSYARCCSILRNVENLKEILKNWEIVFSKLEISKDFEKEILKDENANKKLSKNSDDFNKNFNIKLLKDENEIKLIKHLAKFPYVVEESAIARKTHLLCSYVYELAVLFNQFYKYCPVLKAEEERNARILLVECTRIVLGNALELLGIEGLERM